MKPPPTPTPRWPRRRCGGHLLTKLAVAASVVVLLVIAALSIAGGVGYWMWSSEPDYWQARNAQLESVPEPQLRQQAEDLEQRVVGTLTAVHPPTHEPMQPTPAGDTAATVPPDATNTAGGADVRTITMSFDDVNAWLATRLDGWLANQGEELPPQVSRFMLTAEGDDLVLAFLVDSPQVRQVVSVIFNVQVLRGGQARLRVVEVRGGTLPMPVDALMTQLEEQAPTGVDDEAVARLARALDGETFDPLHEIDKARQARLLALDVSPTGLTATVRVEPR